MVKKQKKYNITMQKGNHKVIAGILTIVILSLVIFAGPTKAFVLGLDANKATLNEGDLITFTAQINLEDMDKFLPINELQLDIFEINGNVSKTCKFDVNGNNISGCEGMTITPLNVPANNEGGYGYGYGYDSVNGYGYDFSYDYGYGYGYGAGGVSLNFKYQITLDTSGYDVGSYGTLLKSLIGSEIFKSNSNPVFEITETSTSGGTGRSSRDTLADLLGIGVLDLHEGLTYDFTVNGEDHTLEITEVGADYALVTIRSDPINLRLDFNNGAQEIDVDGDGIKDISLELVGIDNNGLIKVAYYVLDNEGERQSEEPDEIVELDPTDPEAVAGFFARITGAVVGTLGVAGTWIVGVFLVGLVGMSITVRQIRRKKRLSK
jgi:hypothetical protein